MMRTPAAWEQALQAKLEILAMLANERGRRMIWAWVGDRERSYGSAASNPSVAAAGAAFPDMLKSEPIYITEEMQELAYNAMETFDRTESVEMDDFFLRSGFAYLAEPFITEDIHGKKIAWRAVSWRVVDMFVALDQEQYRDMLPDENKARIFEILQRVGPDMWKITGEEWDFIDSMREKISEKGAKEEPVVRIILWSHIDDEDDFPREEKFVEFHKQLGLMWAPAHMTAIPMSQISDTRATANEGDMKASWLTFLRVINRLMSEKIALKTKRQPSRSWRREMIRRKLPPNEILVVELRRPKSKSTSENGAGTVNYSHQWIVHGFWRRQWYPSLQMHRQKFISDYVKGPKDKPLIVKGRVWLWDR
jgi:hypothetical protein